MDSSFNTSSKSKLKSNASQGGCTSFLQPYSRLQYLQTLKRHAEYSPRVFHRFQSLSDVILKTSASPEAKKLLTMARAVGREAERMRQFTRTQLTERGVLFANITLHHRVEDWILSYFHGRFPRFVIVLFETRHKVSYTIDEDGVIHKYVFPLKETVALVSQNRVIVPLLKGIQHSPEELYRHFYESQFVAERENRKYFKRMIPDSAMNLPGMKGGVEKRFRNHLLDKFLKPKSPSAQRS